MKKEIHLINNLMIPFYIGNNAQDNFDIIDQADPSDLWFHVKDHSSCHVIANISEITDKIKSNKKLKQYIIKKGAVLCKQNTNKFVSTKNLEIIYTNIENIEKTNVLGQVHTKQSKVIVL